MRKRTIEKAKILNCNSEEAKAKSFLHFAFQPFQVLGSRLFASFFFASSQAGRWPSGQGAGHYNQDVDPHVCQGFNAPSLAPGFADFPD